MLSPITTYHARLGHLTCKESFSLTCLKENDQRKCRSSSHNKIHSYHCLSSLIKPNRKSTAKHHQSKLLNVNSNYITKQLGFKPRPGSHPLLTSSLSSFRRFSFKLTVSTRFCRSQVIYMIAVGILRDWPEQILWFGLHNTQLKALLLQRKNLLKCTPQCSPSYHSELVDISCLLYPDVPFLDKLLFHVQVVP